MEWSIPESLSILIVVMSDASIDQLVCIPTNGKTRLSFNRCISDGNSSDDDSEVMESDDHKASESLDDMANELTRFEDADASINKRNNLQKEPSFLFQRMATKHDNEQRARRNQSMKVVQNHTDPPSNSEATIDATSSAKPPFDRLPKMMELRKCFSSCLLLMLPSLVCACVAVVLLLLVRNDGDQVGIANTPPSSDTLTIAPSTISFSEFPAELPVPESAASTIDNDSTDIATTTPLPEELAKKMGSVVRPIDNNGTVIATTSSLPEELVNKIGSVVTTNGATKRTSKGGQARLIGLIDSPLDPDELVLLVEAGPDFQGTVHTRNENSAPALNMSAVREITTGDGTVVYCNVRVDGIAILVECRLNEETCRVYDETNSSSVCDDGETSSR